MAEIEPQNVPIGLYVDGAGKACPIVSVEVKATIAGPVGRMQIEQKFRSDEDAAINAILVFPIAYGDALCGFEILIGDRVVKGRAKGKEAAEREFREAAAAGRHAAMAKESEGVPDVFSTRVNNIQAGEEVTARLTVMTTLLPEEAGVLRLRVPVTVAPRYGARGGVMGVDDVPAEYPVRIEALLYAGSGIESLACPSHTTEAVMVVGDDPGSVEEGEPLDINPDSGAADGIDGSHQFARVALVQEGARGLGGDFLVDIGCEESHKPSVWVEEWEAEGEEDAAGDDGDGDGDGDGGVDGDGIGPAVMLRLFPDVDPAAFDADAACEYVFVVDRSGSMAGGKMRQLIDALRTCLRALPESAYFQIVSFGDRYELLFRGGSKPYNEHTLAEADAYAAAMTANMGGTEILQPLRAILGGGPLVAPAAPPIPAPPPVEPVPDVPMPEEPVIGGPVIEAPVVPMAARRRPIAESDCELPEEVGGGDDIARELLPPPEFQHDGADHLPRQVFLFTDGEVANTGAVLDYVRQRHMADGVRMFSFGIGREASTALVHGLAQVGGGASEMIVPGERLQEKVARQLNRALQPVFRNPRVHWGALERYVAVKGPLEPTPIFAGEQSLHYAILKPTVRGAVPHEVAVTMRAIGPDGIVTWRVPLRIAPGEEGDGGDGGDGVGGEGGDGVQHVHVRGKDIHIAAARAVCLDIERRRGGAEPAMRNLLKAQLQRLGERYNLATSETAFVAVDTEGPAGEVADESRRVGGDCIQASADEIRDLIGLLENPEDDTDSEGEDAPDPGALMAGLSEEEALARAIAESMGEPVAALPASGGRGGQGGRGARGGRPARPGRPHRPRHPHHRRRGGRDDDSDDDVRIRPRFAMLDDAVVHRPSRDARAERRHVRAKGRRGYATASAAAPPHSAAEGDAGGGFLGGMMDAMSSLMGGGGGGGVGAAREASRSSNGVSDEDDSSSCDRADGDVLEEGEEEPSAEFAPSVLERGEQLDDLEERARELEAHSFAFRAAPPGGVTTATSTLPSASAAPVASMQPFPRESKKKSAKSEEKEHGGIARAASVHPEEEAVVPPGTEGADLLSFVVRLQRSNGSFMLSNALASALGKSVEDVTGGKPDGCDVVAWATALALALFETKLAAFRGEWTMIARKSQRYLRRQDGVDAPALIAAANTFISGA